MSSEAPARRLAAIMAADMVGFSRLMEVDEAGTLARLKELRRALIDPSIAAHNGRIFKTTGDGMLADFGSAAEAVECVVEIQSDMARRNEGVPEGERIEFRTGINLGDVIVDGDDIYGEGVNIAARLEGLAEPGGVRITENVHRQVAGKLDIAFEDMGEHTVKNLTRPLHVFRVRLEGEKTLATSIAKDDAGPALTLPDKPSIAVLPFDNMSGDSELEFFADGLAEDILTMLSKVSALFVIARNSTFAYKGQAPDIRRVGEELGVRYVLEGSVRKGGDRLRITAQLIDSADGRHVWAETYNRTVADIFDLQDDITKEIVTALRVRLTDGEAAQVWSRGTDNIEAWKCMVRAVELWQRFGARDLAEALSLAEKAAGLDPDYALAWAIRGMVCWAQARTGGGDEQLAEAEEYAAKSLALDDTDTWTLALNGSVLLSRGRHDEAVATTRQAVERHPGDADVWAFMGFCLLPAGEPEKALQAFADAIRLNPLYPIWYLPTMARARDAMGEPEKAIELAERVLARDPDNFPALLHLASLYARAGRDPEAREAAASVLRRTPGFKVGFTAKWLMTRDEAFAATFAEGLTKAGLPA